MAEYKDILTLDGLVRPQPGVSKRKVEAVGDLIARTMRGDSIAEGTLKEVMTTSDAPLAASHLVTAQLLPQFEKAERKWSQIAGVRTVADFRPVTLQSMFGDLTGAGVREGGGAARVPEAAPYPHVTISGVEAFNAKLQKNGVRFGMTFEARINDPAGFWSELPGELLQLALDTEEAETFDALTEGVASLGSAVELQGGTLPDGTTVAANSPISPDAIWQAIIELSQRQVNGRSVGRLAGGYNVIVPVGLAPFIEFALSQKIIAVQSGSITYDGGDRSVFGSISIIESDKIGLTNPDEWYVLPKPGAYRRPVLELLRLRGYERPEVRVNNLTGNYVGGGAISPFEGSFSNDTIDFRMRMIAGGALWSGEQVIYSDGSGA